MKSTLTVLFIIAAVASSTQTFRHVYDKWLDPRESVLDEFLDETDSSIVGAQSMEQLLDLYREAFDAVEEYELDPNNPKLGIFQRPINMPPYESEYKIRSEIQSRESDEGQLFRIRFYWLCGLTSLFVGIFAFRRINRWLGLTGIIVGFSEMLCWTSPLFSNRVFSSQFESLLNLKLSLSLVTWVLLIGLWLLIEKKRLLDESG